MAIQRTGIAGYRYATTPCRHCGDSISQHSLARHEKLCATLADNVRRDYAQKRKSSRKKRDELGIWPKAYNKAQQAANVKSEQPDSKANGRRVQVTVSVDLEALRRLLLELAPSFSLDKVTIS